MVEDSTEERYFRKAYSDHLQGLKGDAELEEERRKVNQQGLKTPRRRGEMIKHEELDREMVRRHFKNGSNNRS